MIKMQNSGKDSKTLIERFGFKDKDLTTKEHDEMLLWILDKKNALTVLTTCGLVKENQAMRLHRPLYHPNDCNWSWDTYLCSNCDTRSLCTIKNFNEFRNKQQFLLHENCVKINIEQPILGHNNYNIGFVDAEVYVTEESEHIGEEKGCTFSSLPITILCEHYEGNLTVRIEIKPKIESIGELVRQINLYRSHEGDHLIKPQWIIFTKTQNLKEILGSQNILVYDNYGNQAKIDDLL